MTTKPKKPKNDMHTVTVEGYHRDKPVVAKFERGEPKHWSLTLTVDGVERPPITLKGDKPCWAVAKMVIDRPVPIAKVEKRKRAAAKVAQPSPTLTVHR